MLKSFLRRNRKKSGHEIAPEEIFLDSSNIPAFNRDQMEGRIEKAISIRHIFILGIFFFIIGLFFFGRAYVLQIKEGAAYAKKSEDNRLNNSVIVADRGLITDRNGTLLAWNIQGDEEKDYSLRRYIDASGFGNLLGFIKYPAKDAKGFYYKTETTGADGVESYFNDILSGKNGLKIVETDAVGNVKSQSTIKPPEQGKKLVLSIDADTQRAFADNIQRTVETSGFIGGGGIMMDIRTGEVIALATYPGFNSQVMTDGKDSSIISSYFSDKRNVFLDRAIAGLYAPGSIVKPFMALAALNEGVITPEKEIESKGFISIPNPYFPDKPSVFRDWRVNGWTDAREAIAVSSDVYFYAVGGGYEDQKGMGIAAIDKYISMFGFGKAASSFFSIKNNGVVPTPEWKKKAFNGDIWRLGDTYTSSIGQFGFQVTPVQAVRAVAALVNGGTLIDPVIVKKGEEGYEAPPTSKVEGVREENYVVAKEGMRLAVTDGTLTMLNFPDIKVAAKSGTAELGSEKKYINSWVTGFFPYENPRYAFAVVLEKGPAKYAEGAPVAMQRTLYEMASSSAEYLR